ncbi:MAG: hypothetical protein WC384_03940 [Prolixibacteraceae bacterium]
MANFNVVLSNLFSAIFTENSTPWNLFLLFVLLWIALTAVVIYFVTHEYKKNFGFERNNFKSKIRKLEEDFRKLSEENNSLNYVLKDYEDQKEKWAEEEKLLQQKILDLENQIAELTKSSKPEDEDIIVEYYLDRE